MAASSVNACLHGIVIVPSCCPFVVGAYRRSSPTVLTDDRLVTRLFVSGWRSVYRRPAGRALREPANGRPCQKIGVSMRVMAAIPPPSHMSKTVHVLTFPSRLYAHINLFRCGWRPRAFVRNRELAAPGTLRRKAWHSRLHAGIVHLVSSFPTICGLPAEQYAAAQITSPRRQITIFMPSFQRKSGDGKPVCPYPKSFRAGFTGLESVPAVRSAS